MTMNVDLMYFEGCPHWRETAGHLEALRQVRGDFDVRLVEVTTPEAADEWRFHGSPSVAINGIDPFSGLDNPVGLTCRTYVTDHGVAGSPTREQLSRAIINAAQVLPNVE
jgi:hypothetical protein